MYVLVAELICLCTILLQNLEHSISAIPIGGLKMVVFTINIFCLLDACGDTPINTETLSGAKLVLVWDSEVVDLDSSDTKQTMTGFWALETTSPYCR
jgi:hypothetical protein